MAVDPLLGVATSHVLVNGAHIDERAMKLLAAIQRGRARHLKEKAQAARAGIGAHFDCASTKVHTSK